MEQEQQQPLQQLVDSGKIFDYIDLSDFNLRKDDKKPVHSAALKLVERVRKQKGGNGVPAE